MATKHQSDELDHSDSGGPGATAYWTISDVWTSTGIGSDVRPNVSSTSRFTR
jgi:hypothetical protein